MGLSEISAKDLVEVLNCSKIALPSFKAAMALYNLATAALKARCWAYLCLVAEARSSLLALTLAWLAAMFVWANLSY